MLNLLVQGQTFYLELFIDEDSLVCGIATDDIWNITWGITFAGSFDNQPCPPRNGFVVTGNLVAVTRVSLFGMIISFLPMLRVGIPLLHGRCPLGNISKHILL